MAQVLAFEPLATVALKNLFVNRVSGVVIADRTPRGPLQHGADLWHTSGYKKVMGRRSFAKRSHRPLGKTVMARCASFPSWKPVIARPAPRLTT